MNNSSRPAWAKGGRPRVAPRSGPSYSRNPTYADLLGKGDARPSQEQSHLPDGSSPTVTSRRQRLGIATALASVGLVAGLLGGLIGAKMLRPSVVTKASSRQAPKPTQSRTGPTLAALYQRLKPSVVKVVSGGPGAAAESAGGVILDAEGTVLTVNTPALSRGGIAVVMSNGMRHDATVAGIDSERNLAALRIVGAPPGLAAVRLGDSHALAPGDQVFAMGSPFGIQDSFTAGIVSGVGRSLEPEGPRPALHDLIQTDAAMNEGSFGGPLVNLAGDVVGVNIAIQSPVGAFVGVAYAVPINSVTQNLLARIQEV